MGRCVDDQQPLDPVFALREVMLYSNDERSRLTGCRARSRLRRYKDPLGTTSMLEPSYDLLVRYRLQRLAECIVGSLFTLRCDTA